MFLRKIKLHIPSRNPGRRVFVDPLTSLQGHPCIMPLLVGARRDKFTFWLIPEYALGLCTSFPNHLRIASSTLWGLFPGLCTYQSTNWTHFSNSWPIGDPGVAVTGGVNELYHSVPHVCITHILQGGGRL